MRGRAGIAVAALLALPGAASAAVTTTVRFDYTGTAQTFVVPAGVTQIHVVAVGGSGGFGAAHTTPGGRGAIVGADLPVTPGTLRVMVGGNGGDGSGSAGGAGGFNGGAAGGAAAGNGFGGGGGGGASDVRTGAGLATRLLVAAGGGGAGGDYANVNAAGFGGAADAAGGAGRGPDAGGGGGAGTALAGGAGGTRSAADCGNLGIAGSAGSGGAGGDGVGSFGPGGGGGGGGGGLFGGGGGGSGCNGSSGGGGGGGASFVAGETLPLPPPADVTGVPSITISYVSSGPSAQAAPGSLSFNTQPASTVSAPQTVTITNDGPAPLHIQGMTFTGAGASSYIVDASGCIAPVAPAGACALVVRFAPSSQGALDATMQIDSDGGSPTVSLTGTGGALPQGAQGVQGQQGSQGAPGAQGPPGSVKLVTCRIVTKRVRRHHRIHIKKVKKCTTKTITGSATFTAARR